MTALAADTHAAIWFLLARGRLSVAALHALRQAVLGGERIYVSAISLVEIRFLIERGRVDETIQGRLLAAFSDEDNALTLVPIGLDVALATGLIPRSEVPDMPDRIIAATALHLSVPLVTRDRRIRAAALETIW